MSPRILAVGRAALPTLLVALQALVGVACRNTRASQRRTVPERPHFEIRMADPAYFARPGPAQELPMTRRIHRIVHPTLGAPALAVAGGLLRVRLAARNPTERKSVARASLRLETRVAGHRVRLPLTLVRVETTERVSGHHGKTRDSGSMVGLLLRIPSSTPRETFDLVAVVPGVPTARQPRAVRILRQDPATRPFRIALVADQQLWDPTVVLSSGRLNARAYPKRGETQESRAMARQVLHEVGLWDPAFAVQLGDVVFGLDYEKELADAISMLGASPVASFMVPGNHDAYARYGVDLKLGLAGLAAAAIRCRGLVPTSRSLFTPSRIWKLVVCVYGDVKQVLFRRLLYDGLVAWRRNLGPPAYSFRVGRFQFIALNTYDGTAARRHAYSLWVDFRGLHLGAPMVDNYGGYLTQRQLRFVEREAKAAHASGRTVVFIGHHDPRGNASGQRYHENEAFPTSPVGIGHFEEWNYDSTWDSDPRDERGRERPTAHSGHALLRIVARYGAAYLSGHVHRDEQRTYRRGERILGDLRATRDLTFLRVTTASSSTTQGGKWGYRIITAHPDGRLELTPFDKRPLRWSVPAGNLWVTGQGAPRIGTGPRGSGLTVHSGLPRRVGVRVRAVLPLRPRAGYRFSVRAPARVRSMGMFPLPGRAGQPKRALHYLRLDLPAASNTVVTDPTQLQRTDIRIGIGQPH